jgi:hypothetical protein
MREDLGGSLREKRDFIKGHFSVDKALLTYMTWKINLFTNPTLPLPYPDRGEIEWGLSDNLPSRTH